MQSSSSGSRGQWEDYVEQARVKLPEPPPNVQDIYVKWIPWIAIIFGVIGILFSLFALLVGSVLAPLAILFGGAEGLSASMGGMFTVVLWGIGSAFGLVGGWMMKQLKATGWWIYAISLAIGLVGGLARFNVLGIVITLVLAWIHVFVRPRYL